MKNSDDLAVGHELALALRSAYRSMHRQVNGVLARSGVTADQFVVLGLLRQCDGISQQELCRRASSDPNTVRAMLVLLERNGLVVRRPHPADRRALAVSLTAPGRERYTRLQQQIAPLQRLLAGLFSVEEARQLISSIERISQAMTPPVSGAPPTDGPPHDTEDRCG